MTSCCAVLMLVCACSSPSNDCTDCGKDAQPDAGAEASPDAAPSEDAGTDASQPFDAAVDASAAMDATVAEDASPALDAEPPDSEPAFVECTVASDCALPPELLTCQRCADGSSACPEVRCTDRLCAILTPRPCAEHRPAACATDVDCLRPDCTLKCQGDGRNACFRPDCMEGLCIPSYATCGLHFHACPENSKAGQECGECSDAGQCAFRVLGCFDACGDAGVCAEPQACVEGLCQLVACPGP